jgi:hypothetical protein
MDKRGIKTQIKHLEEMKKEKLSQAKKLSSSLIAIPAEEKEAQEAYKWAFYCREAAKFAGYYLKTLEYQKKI